MEELATLADLESVLETVGPPLVLFKHSTRCGLSSGALRAFRAFADAHPGAARFTFVDLIAHRGVSDAIAERLNVEHASPQAIVVRDGAVAGVLTHSRITGTGLGRLLDV